MTVRLGILSTAAIVGRAILPVAATLEEVTVVAVASRERARAESYAAEHAIPRAHGTYDALLADPEVDAVYVALPNGLHAEWATKAAEAGKHVLCEKPFSRNPDGVAEAFAAAEAQGVVMMEAFMYRHHPQTKRAVELVASGEIGKPVFVRTAMAFPGVRVFSEDNVRFNADLDGGALLDLGSYCVSGVRIFGGEPTRVYGVQVDGDAGADLAFSGLLETDAGVMCQIQCGFTSFPRSEIDVVGTDGRLVLRSPWVIDDPGIDIWTASGHRRLEIEPLNSYRLQLQNFCGSIRGDVKPLLNRNDTMQQATALSALYESARTGAAVTL